MKKIVICLCLISFLTVGCGCNNSKKEEEKEKLDFDVNFNVSKDQEKDGLKITNVSLVVDKDGISRYSANVINNTEEVYKLSTIKVIFKNKDNNIIEELIGTIGSDIAPSQSRSLTLSTDKNLLDSYTIEYEIIK